MGAIPGAGLSASEARERLAKFGANELPTVQRSRFLPVLSSVLQEPMLVLLLGAAGIYVAVGEHLEAAMLGVAATVIVVITVVQERRSEQALEALRDLSSPRATVVRDGTTIRIPGREVVPGDLALIMEGDRVPADAEVISATNLAVDESLLTGESVSVEKTGLDSVMSGTLVVRGEGTATVTATGAQTALGKIGTSLSTIEEQPTHLQRSTRALVKVFAAAAGLACILVAVVYSLSHRDWPGGILAGITTAISAIPEEFPLVLTIFLALGALRLARRSVLTRRVAAIEGLGAATVLCVDKTGTITQNRMTVAQLAGPQESWSPGGGTPIPKPLEGLAEAAALACSASQFDPMERAIRELYSGNGYSLPSDAALIRKYPLSPNLLAMAHAWSQENGDGFDVAMKGAPEAVAEMCRLAPSEADRLREKVDALAAEGYRVLGVAREHWKRPLPGHHSQFTPEFLGLVALADPARPGVDQAVRDCRSAGIRVIMITGDHPSTAQAIARRIGLDGPDTVVTGQAITGMSPGDLREVVAKTSVFARITPQQKLQIVEALKQNGEVVGMTGDGVNDGPALRASDIGIAMGQRGTDVAREAADIVLLDDDFASIVAGIRLGRRIHTNLKNAMRYLLAVHVPIVGMSFVPVLLDWPLILMPAHVVLLEMVVDPGCTMVFEAEPSESDAMARPPRNPNEPLFTWPAVALCSIQGAGTLAVCLVLFFLGLRTEQGSVNLARTVSYSVLLLSNVALIATNLSTRNGTLRTLLLPNKPLRLVFAGVVAALLAVLTVPLMQRLFRFEPLTLYAAGLIAAGTLASLVWLEAIKAIRRRYWPSQLA